MKNLLKKKNSLNKGFTLVELLVVVVIIGLLVAIAIPKLGSARDTAEDAALRAAAVDINKGIQRCYIAGYAVTATTSVTAIVNGLLARGHFTGDSAAELIALNGRVAAGKQLVASGSGANLSVVPGASVAKTGTGL